MKAWVTYHRIEAWSRCPQCGLGERDAVEAEETVAAYERPRVWRHSACGHILMYSSQSFTRNREDVIALRVAPGYTDHTGITASRMWRKQRIER